MSKEQPGQYPDPEAIRQKRIAELTANIEHWHRVIGRFGSSTQPERDELARYEAELSCLHNEQGDAAKETDGQLLARLGDDATKWAAEFRQTAIRLGYSDMDEEWLIGWFANAIEHSSQVRSPSPSQEPQDVRARVSHVLDNLNSYGLHSEKIDAILAAVQSSAQPVGWQCRPKPWGTNTEWSNCAKWQYDDPQTGYEYRALYAAPPRPDASGLIEAVEWPFGYQDTFNLIGAAVAPTNPRASAVSISVKAFEEAFRALRSRAADRSAPRSDIGGA